jgi:hypothetical protein
MQLWPGSVDWDVARALGAANDAVLPYLKNVMSNVQKNPRKCAVLCKSSKIVVNGFYGSRL